MKPESKNYWRIFIFGTTPAQKREIEFCGTHYGAMIRAGDADDEVEWDVLRVELIREEEAP